MITLVQKFISRLRAFFAPYPSPSGFAEKQPALEARLAIRTREFEEAKARAQRMRDEYEFHATEGDWGEEKLQIHLANGSRDLTKARLLFKQVKALQENLQTLSTATLGNAILVDASVAVTTEEIEALDRSYFELNAQRKLVAKAEQNLAESLLADDRDEQEQVPQRIEKEKSARHLQVAKIPPAGDFEP